MLNVLLIVSVTTSMVYGAFLTVKPVSWFRSLVKTSAVGALALLSIVLETHIALVLALLFGTLGDFALSREGERNFLLGLGSFLIGHSCFIALFLHMSSSAYAFDGSQTKIVFALAFSALAIGVFAHLNKYLGSMRFPVAAYVLVSWVLGICALLLPSQDVLQFAVPGTFLFILSDIILAYELFFLAPSSTLRPFTSRILWFLYWGGQAMIVFGVYTFGV